MNVVAGDGRGKEKMRNVVTVPSLSYLSLYLLRMTFFWKQIPQKKENLEDAVRAAKNNHKIIIINTDDNDLFDSWIASLD